MKIIDALLGILILYGAYLVGVGVERFIDWIIRKENKDGEARNGSA